MKPLVEKMNSLQELHKYGQSVWLDYIRRSLMTSGELKRMIEEDGLRGMTSNPSIFEKAIAGSGDYAEEIQEARGKHVTDPGAVYEQLAVKDIQAAADFLRSVYDKSNRRDGYVSLEVSPLLASNTQKTIDEARRLWKTVDRENLMVKVPATPEGLPAIKQLISEGINVNVTLLFAQKMYEQVAEAYVAGLEQLQKNGGDVSKIGSVASFFISRIDSAVDKLLDEKIKAATSDKDKEKLQALKGKVAIANAKLAYQHYLRFFATDRWKALEAKGAHTQRLLWASTSTKNPSYRDVIYVEELIGEDTVNTIPPATFDAFRDHGRVRKSLVEGVDQANEVMASLKEGGVSIDSVTDKLLTEGVSLFVEPFKQLLETLEKQLSVGQRRAMDRLTYKMPDDLTSMVKAALQDWRENDKVRKLWACDASLWTGSDEAQWLGWLGITDAQLAHADQFAKLADEVKKSGFTHALLLGMGGSSLCPEVLSKTFGRTNGYPELHILDSTDPAQVKSTANRVDIAKTIFFVSSKSGSTLEPNIFQQYFWDRAKEKVGADKVGQHFIAITDPGSKMQQIAEREKFRLIFFGLPSIGGRYSALSNFGMIPGAVMGIDVKQLLEHAEEMVHACSSCVPAEENPGLVLGAVMGVLAKTGRDKVTLVTSPAIYDLGAWLEQLLAESTGKQGHGLIPVDREKLASPEAYGKDRLFAYLRYEPAADPEQDKAIDQLEKAGQPVVRIAISDLYQLGQEFFRWEFATAVAGSIIGINAFNQPDVEASKVATRQLTDEYEKTGKLPPETPFFEGDGIKLFTDKENAAALEKAVGSDKSLAGFIKAHLGRLAAGDYFALLAYVEMNDKHEESLQEIRHWVRDKKNVATCLGFGPRFLHSTGQAYKGGPNSGVFLQITCDDAEDVPVPGQKYTFGVVKAAQARGDFQVLAERKRRALRVHLTKDVAGSLAKLKDAIASALK
jgi:transaldolase/glucose-6-phosphate isomerase